MVSKSGCLGWLRQRSNLEKTLLSLSSLLLLTLLLLILIGVALQKCQNDSPAENLKECWSRDCIVTAGQILSQMNSEADACSDLYEFSCGHYGRGHGQTESVQKSSADSVYFAAKRLMESPTETDILALNSVRTLYSACMDFGFSPDGRSPKDLVEHLLDSHGLGSWPVLDDHYDDPPLTLEQRLSALALVDVPVVFRLEVVPDSQLPDSYLVKVSPGGPRESHRSAFTIRSDVLLSDGMRTRFLRLGGSVGRVASEVEDILSIDASFAEMEQASNHSCDTIDLIPPESSMQEMNRLIRDANWTQIFSPILAAAGLMRPFAVELHCKAKIEAYLKYLRTIPPDRSVFNYLGWRFVSKFSEYMGPDFARQLSGSKAVPRWRHCLGLVEKFAGPLLAEGLMQHQKEDIEEKAREIVNSTFSTTELLLSRTQWLTSTQRSRIQKQLSSLSIRLPFRNKRVSNRSLSVQIPEVNRDNFTSVVVSLHRQWVIHHLKKLSHRRPQQEHYESWNSLLSAPKLSPLKDRKITVYFDKVQEPYLRLHGTDWLNYGGLGISTAREICKMLLTTDLGVSVNDRTSLWDIWLSNENTSECFLNFFHDSFGLDFEAKSSNKLKDLFLDRCSLEIAYEGAKSRGEKADEILPGLELSSRQMFFLSYAQSSCIAESPRDSSSTIPVRERVNTAVSSFRVFKETFECKIPSMVTCHLWT